MKFQTVLYLAFLAVTWLVAMGLRSSTARRNALLVASYAFYATFGVAFVAVLFATSSFNYAMGRALRRSPRSALLWTGLTVNIVLLLTFRDAATMMRSLGFESSALANLIAPIGLSFYTFQAMSHLLDTYRGGTVDDEPTYVEFLLFMAFWPTVAAGPVCRVGEMIPQFRKLDSPAFDDVSTGVRRILIGLFLKVVLADVLANGIDQSEGVVTGFDTLSSGWSGTDVWFLGAAFGFQLFFDFAGYSNIAIGSARLFGVTVRENFDDPYLSTSPSEFWTRWHMSLSSWIRDYLFFPLATMRRQMWWRHLALVVSMVVFGIWHGLSATFALWGLYHGLVLVAHRLWQKFTARPGEARHERRGASQLALTLASWGVTFALITLGWVLFRSHSLSQAATMLQAIVTPTGYFKLSMRLNFYVLVSTAIAGYFACAGLREYSRRMETHPAFARVTFIAKPVLYSAMIISIIVGSRIASTFVYVRF